MHFHIMTLFPEMVLDGLHTSIIGRAEEKGFISVEAVNIRDYTLDKHKKVDDYTYGGGAGRRSLCTTAGGRLKRRSPRGKRTETATAAGQGWSM